MKVKYLAWFNVFFVVLTVIFDSIENKIAAVLSLSNFIIFFGGDLWKKQIYPKASGFISVYSKKRKRRKFKVITPPKKLNLFISAGNVEKHPGNFQICFWILQNMR